MVHFLVLIFMYTKGLNFYENLCPLVYISSLAKPNREASNWLSGCQGSIEDIIRGIAPNQQRYFKLIQTADEQARGMSLSSGTEIAPISKARLAIAYFCQDHPRRKLIARGWNHQLELASELWDVLCQTEISGLIDHQLKHSSSFRDQFAPQNLITGKRTIPPIMFTAGVETADGKYLIKYIPISKPYLGSL